MELNGYRLLALCELEVNWEFHSVLLLCWCAVISAAVITYFFDSDGICRTITLDVFQRHVQSASTYGNEGLCQSIFIIWCMRRWIWLLLHDFLSILCTALSMMSYHELF